LKLAVITMVQHRDFPTAWSSLGNVGSQLDEQTQRFVLFNDPIETGGQRRLVERLEGLDHTTIIEAGSNLGVARGRNRLIEAALEWGADAIVSLDDDILTASDFLARVRASLNALGDTKIGVLAPAVLDYHHVRSAFHSDETSVAVTRGEHTEVPDTAQLRTALQASYDALPEAAVFHLGICGWRDHYLRSGGGVANKLRLLAGALVDVTIRPAHPDEPYELRRRADMRHRVLTGVDDPVPTDTLPGGACILDRRMLKTIGLHDEAFSPFGYEDAEICIRARQHGFTNYVLPAEIVLHDLQHRTRRRQPVALIANRAKARVLLLRHNAGAPDIASLVGEVFGLGWMEATLLRGHTPLAAVLLAYGAGLVAGLFADLTIPRSDEPASPRGTPRSQPPGVARIGRLQVEHRGISVHDWRPTGAGATSIPRAVDLVVRGIRVSVSDILAHRTEAIDIALSYELDGGVLTLHRLRASSPGLVDVWIRAVISGVTDEATSPDVLTRNIALESLDLELYDNGLIARAEEAYAWQRKRRLGPTMAALSSGLRGRIGATARILLVETSTPRRLSLRMRPPVKVTAAALAGMPDRADQLWNALGLSLRVEGEGAYDTR
jgi:GT2 family glycosyltransferase